MAGTWAPETPSLLRRSSRNDSRPLKSLPIEASGRLFGWCGAGGPSQGKHSSAELGAELVGGVEWAPISLAGDLGQVVKLELSQLVVLLSDLGARLVELCHLIGHEKADRLIELARQVVLRVGVGAARLIRRALRGLTAVDESDETHHGIAISDELLELLMELEIGEMELALHDHFITTQRRDLLASSR